MRVSWVLVLLIVAGLMVVVHSAGKVGVGYAAKQLCSGVFVSGLPAKFVVENDIEPRLATVPLLSRFLTTGVDGETASARVLTAQAEATYRAGYGCTLHGDVAESATPNAVASAQVLDWQRQARLERCLSNAMLPQRP
jgi:hypothetical protein